MKNLTDKKKKLILQNKTINIKKTEGGKNPGQKSKQRREHDGKFKKARKMEKQ